jgi:hypothetical protein
LSPMSLELDVRWLRLVSILFGLAASLFAGLAILRVVRPASTRTACFFLFCSAVMFLALAKNPTFDLVHPDNLHVMHGLLLFWLCLLAIDTKKFWIAVVTMIIGGLGLYAKQTEAVSFLGPAAVFLLLRPWGWRRSLLLAGIGALVCGASLALLWHQPYAKFYTWTILTNQTVIPRKILVAFHELTFIHHGLLQIVAVAGLICFARGNPRERQYVLCWLLVGVFVAAPSISAFLKEEGFFNNLILFRLWMFLIALPFLCSVFDSLFADDSRYHFRLFNLMPVRVVIGLTGVASLLWLLPHRAAPPADFVQYCSAIDKAVKIDIEARKRVLVAHGTEFLVRAGSTDIPLDRANSILEMNLGKRGEVSAMKTRLQQQYYDKIYLLASNWYGPDILATLKENYRVESTIKGAVWTFRGGYQSELMEDCLVMVKSER